MSLSPKDHAEAVAIFRSEIIGGLTRRELDRGELHRELLAIAKQRWRAPDADHTRTYGVRTLERWYSAGRDERSEARRFGRAERGQPHIEWSRKSHPLIKTLPRFIWPPGRAFACPAPLPSGRQRVALFDIGGGSTEAILGAGRHPQLSNSLKLGVLRLRAHWLPQDPATADELAVMTEWLRMVLRPTIDRFKDHGCDAVALTSGSALQLARLVGRRLPPQAGIDRYKLSLDAVAALEQQLCAMTPNERAALPGLDEARVYTIVPGAVVVRSILQLAGVSHALVCHAALREGLIADYLRLRRERQTDGLVDQRAGDDGGADDAVGAGTPGLETTQKVGVPSAIA